MPRALQADVEVPLRNDRDGQPKQEQVGRHVERALQRQPAGDREQRPSRAAGRRAQDCIRRDPAGIVRKLAQREVARGTQRNDAPGRSLSAARHDRGEAPAHRDAMHAAEYAGEPGTDERGQGHRQRPPAACSVRGERAAANHAFPHGERSRNTVSADDAMPRPQKPKKPIV